MAKKGLERDEEDLVRLYLSEIGQYPLLTKDDEGRLARQIEGGNVARGELEKGTGLSATNVWELRRAVTDGELAQRTFVESNLRLVVSIAKKYQASGLPLLDLIQEGNDGPARPGQVALLPASVALQREWSPRPRAPAAGFPPWRKPGIEDGWEPIGSKEGVPSRRRPPVPRSDI